MDAREATNMVSTGWVCWLGFSVGIVLHTEIIVVQSRKERKSWSELRQRRSSANRLLKGSGENRFLPENSSHRTHTYSPASIYYFLFFFFFIFFFLLVILSSGSEPLSSSPLDAESQNTKKFTAVVLGPIPDSSRLNSCGGIARFLVQATPFFLLGIFEICSAFLITISS